MSSAATVDRREHETESVAASTTIDASPEVVFAAGWPTRRPALTSTAPAGRASADGDRITGAGQVFRLAMYHKGHPDKDYETANLVELFDEPHAIARKP